MKKEVFESSHALESEDVLERLKTDEDGLSSEEARVRLKEHGFNELPEKKRHGYLIAFLKQFKSLFVYILLAAAVISYFIGHYVDMYVILFIILVNGGIGFFQEQKAEKSVKALKKLVVSYAKVYRDKDLVKVKTRSLVPGDVILLEEGDRVPADARLIEVKNFSTVESSLTGESSPIEKNLKVLPEGTGLADRMNIVFLGTFVASGTAKAVVVGTGGDTAIGKIALSLENIKRQKSHFSKKTDKLALQMGTIAFIGAFIVFMVGFFVRKLEFTDMFLFTLSSLISGIPEGLPAVLAIVLAIGAVRMSRKNAIVRNLQATETLGVVDTIISDKTGTLTENTMTIRNVVLPFGDDVEVTGDGWDPKGNFLQKDRKIVPLENKELRKLLHICSVCNNSKLIREGKKYSIIGDPTEASLIVLAEKAGLKKDVMEKHEKRIDDLPFDQRLKYRASLSVLVDKKDKKEIYVVGAPEAVLAKSNRFFKADRKLPMGDKKKKELFKKIEEMTSSAMRVLALAYVDAPSNSKELREEEVKNLVFVGLVGMIDPPREEIKESIEKAKKAGIRVIMATGDHKGTAVAIAKEVSLLGDESDKYPEALTEEEMKGFSEGKFKDVVRNVSVFARLTPQMKLKIAETLQNDGKIVAMTGDGVNDAPVLKKADVGISMGIIGTDVARESSEIVLADDNFASIVNAVEEGRIVFNNTRKTSFFLVTTNMAEHATLISTLLFGLPLPLLPTQILWLNLVTDTGAGIGLATEPGHDDVLSEKPRKAEEEILSKEIIPFLILMVSAMLAFTLIIFNAYLPDGLEKARTGAFAVMSLTQLFNSFNMRSLRKSVFEIGFWKNRTLMIALGITMVLFLGIIYTPVLQGFFGFVNLSFFELALIFVLSSSVLFLGEGYKFVRKKFNLRDFSN